MIITVATTDRTKEKGDGEGDGQGEVEGEGEREGEREGDIVECCLQRIRTFRLRRDVLREGARVRISV